jgi:hypothetical protein
VLIGRVDALHIANLSFPPDFPADSLTQCRCTLASWPGDKPRRSCSVGGLLAAAECQARGADIFAAVTGVHGGVPLT